MLRVRSYAKINLYLDVLKKRRDGYHNIETIFQSVSLCDDLTFEPLESPDLTLECSDPTLDTGPANLVTKAAALLQQTAHCQLGAHIRLTKRIPIAAGLAGGSGNAAATLLALNRLWDLRLDQAALHGLALQLGSDVPYCLRGGTVAATGRGEIMTELAPLRETYFVLVHPPVRVSTRDVYNSPRLIRNVRRPTAGRTPAFRAALRELESGRLERAIANAMESAVFHDHPELAEIKRTLLAAGCIAAAMSGSGPTLFGLCPTTAGRPTAEIVARAIAEYPTSIVRTVPRAIEFTD